MSRYSSEINILTSSDIPNTINNWITLLNFFSLHKDDLDIQELNTLLHKSERCRHEWNITHNDQILQDEVQPDITIYVRNLLYQAE